MPDISPPDELKHLFDVDPTGLANGDTFVWNSSTEKFEAGAGGGGGSTTPRVYTSTRFETIARYDNAVGEGSLAVTNNSVDLEVGTSDGDMTILVLVPSNTSEFRPDLGNFEFTFRAKMQAFTPPQMVNGYVGLYDTSSDLNGFGVQLRLNGADGTVDLITANNIGHTVTSVTDADCTGWQTYRVVCSASSVKVYLVVLGVETLAATATTHIPASLISFGLFCRNDNGSATDGGALSCAYVAFAQDN